MARPRGHKHDKTDDRIIAALQETPNLELIELAQKVGLKYSSCQRKVAHLISVGSLTKSVSLTPPKKLGSLSHLVAVMIKSPSRKTLDFVGEKISKMKNIEFCIELNGKIDFMVLINASEMAEFESIRDEIKEIRMNDIEVVEDTNSSIIAKSFKGF